MNRSNTRKLRRLIILCVGLSAFAALPLLSSARSTSSINTNSINIVNNSSRVIRYVYLSPVTADDWTGDQLGGNGISPGQWSTVSNFSCGQQQIKVIGEDQDGCFLSTVVDCATNITWTITNDTAVDCGQ